MHLYYGYVAGESLAGEIVKLETELLCSCKEIPVYEEDTKKSNVFTCPMQDDLEI